MAALTRTEIAHLKGAANGVQCPECDHVHRNMYGEPEPADCNGKSWRSGDRAYICAECEETWEPYRFAELLAEAEEDEEAEEAPSVGPAPWKGEF